MNTLDWNLNNIIEISGYLSRGEVVVLPTDTLYGLVAKADNEQAVKKVYEVKKRNLEKKCIVLISDLEDLTLFDIVLSDDLKQELARYWPGKVSIELPCITEKMSYLRRGTNSLSFRFPKDELLCALLKITGPLIAPSANPEGLEPAINIGVAQKYFGEQVDLYVDDSERVGSPSTLISLVTNKPEVLRGTMVVKDGKL